MNECHVVLQHFTENLLKLQIFGKVKTVSDFAVKSLQEK